MQQSRDISQIKLRTKSLAHGSGPFVICDLSEILRTFCSGGIFVRIFRLKILPWSHLCKKMTFGPKNGSVEPGHPGSVEPGHRTHSSSLLDSCSGIEYVRQNPY